MPRIFRNGRDYSGSSAQIDDNTAANNKVYSSVKVNTLLSGKASATVDKVSSSSAISLNGKYTIPSNILAHSIIIVSFKRQGKGNSHAFHKDELLAFDNGVGMYCSASEYYTFKVIEESGEKKIQVTAIQGLNEPYITLVGIF